MATKVTLLLGGLLGTEADRPTSVGMLELVDLLKPLPVEVKDWGEWATVRAPTNSLFVLIGYSGGGTRAIMWANWMSHVPVDLMILYDPSPSWQMQPVRDNVKQVLTYENSAPNMPSLFGNLGGGIVTLAPGNGVTQVHRYHIAEQHMKVQSDPMLHDYTVAEIKALRVKAGELE